RLGRSLTQAVADIIGIGWRANLRHHLGTRSGPERVGEPRREPRGMIRVIRIIWISGISVTPPTLLEVLPSGEVHPGGSSPDFLIKESAVNLSRRHRV